MNASVPVITLDGPGGSGKGTVCLLLAEKLGWHILDSGSLYRLTALESLRSDVEEESQLVEIAENMDIEYVPEGSSLKVMLQGRDVTDAIRAEDVGSGSSEIAAFAELRRSLLELKRAFARPPGNMADRMEMCTVVFPYAPLKILLTEIPQESSK